MKRGAKSTDPILKTHFGQAFSRLVGNSSDKELAYEFGTNPSTIYRWRNGRAIPDASLLIKIARKYDTNIDNLLGNDKTASIDFLKSEYVLKHNGLLCLLNLPKELPAAKKESLVTAFQALKMIIKTSNDTYGQVIDNLYAGISWKARLGLLELFQTNSLNFLNIPTSKQLEDDVREKYGLKKVYVIDIDRNTMFALIRAEIVALFAAKVIFQQLSNLESVGIGSGYTLQRFAENTYSSQKDFLERKTLWIPLMSFSEENMSFMTANHIASFLAARHNGTKWLPLHFESQKINLGVDSPEIFLDNPLKMRELFLTANGTVRPKLGLSSLELNMRTANHTEFTRMDRYFLQLPPEIQRKVAGEILGRLIDDDGKEIEYQHQEIRQISEKRLKEYAKSKYHVWIIAGRGYKSRAILAAIKGGLVNSLVIDREIAEDLLEPEKLIFEPANEFWDNYIAGKQD